MLSARGKRRPEHYVDPVLGGDPYEATVGAYVRNLITGTSMVIAKRRRSILSDCELLVELTNTHESVAASKHAAPAGDRKVSEAEVVSRLRALARRWRGKNFRPPSPAEPVTTNLGALADVLGLSGLDQRILEFTLAKEHCMPFREVTGLYSKVNVDGAAKIIAVALGVAEREVIGALQPRARLVASGLIEIADEICALDEKITASSVVGELVLCPHLDRQKIMDKFLSAARPPTLVANDFDHLKTEVATTLDLLRAALRERRVGVNVLLYGPTGTGKSELARHLAAEIGAPLYVCGHDDCDDHEGDADENFERLVSLMVGNHLVGKTNALLLFDEFEDLFAWGFAGRQRLGTPRMSKLIFNDLLETNAAPTIWISNEVAGVDPAYLRRFSYAIEVPALGARQRARVLKRHLGEPCPLSDGDVNAIAERFEASPAQLGSAVATAKMLAGSELDRASVERVLAPVVKLVTGTDASRLATFDPSKYRVDVLNSPHDLAGIADQLAGWKPSSVPGVSLCLHGPSGTGKSEYVKYLAHRMGRKVVYRRVSDLQSMWVGECEKNIARAFRDAEQDDAVLLFDEADSFLRDRRGAVRGWEVSQVNEFLQQLESFRGVVACTTNLVEELDQASLRRFVFKVRFDYMKPEQAVKLLRATFASATTMDDNVLLASVRRLLPLGAGDFAVVKRRIRILGRERGIDEILDALSAETSGRKRDRRLGFC